MTTSGYWSPSAGMASELDRGTWALLELGAGSPRGQWGLHPAACTPPEISGVEMCGDSFPSCTDLSVGSHQPQC